jgi:CRP-like cAMP-binding protein
VVSLQEMLRASLWAEALTPRELAQVCEEAHERRVNAGAHVARSGAPAECWFGVKQGLLKMSVCSSDGKESTFTGVTAGGWFGEGTLLKDCIWRYDAVALRESQMACIPRATFRRLVQTSLPFNHFLLAHLNARLALFISLVEYDRLLGPDARVARCLASLFDPNLYPHTGLFLELSQEEIGHLSALSRQRANEALHELERAGLLRCEFGGVSVLDLQGLRSYSGAAAPTGLRPPAQAGSMSAGIGRAKQLQAMGRSGPSRQ